MTTSGRELTNKKRESEYPRVELDYNATQVKYNFAPSNFDREFSLYMETDKGTISGISHNP